MSKIILSLLCLLLVGCGVFGKIKADFGGHEEYCIDGVKYIQFTSGATVKYLPNGQIATCK